MAHKGALKPEPYAEVREIWNQRNKEVEKQGVIDPEDQELYAVSTLPGWTRLKTHIDSLKKGLDKRLSEAVLGGLSDEQIRRDATFSVLGKELLDSIINKVEDSALVVEEINNGQGAETKS